MAKTAIRERIYQQMLLRGVTQAMICNDLGLQVSNFNAYIRGNRTISFRDLVSVMTYLHISVAPIGTEFTNIPPDKMNEVFRERIKRSGLKMSEISAASGICSSSISSIITGKRTASSRNLGKLMTALGLDIVPYKRIINKQ